MSDPIAPEVAPAAPVDAAPAAPAPVEPPAAPNWDGKVESLDPAVQKIIGDLRKEAGDNRVAKKTLEEQRAAILTAAGLAPDAPDPIEVAKQSTAEATSAKRELAVFKAAAATGADPSKLLDSNSFTASINGIDPTDGAAITAAITAAIAANPLLKAVQAAAASGTELGGSGEQGQITDEQLARMSPEQIDKALKEGKLAHLL